MHHRPWKTSKFQSSALIALAVLLMIIFTLVGYFFTLPDLERSQRAEQLAADIDTNWQRWKNTKPPAYRYVVERECYCPNEDTSPYEVTVVGNALVEAGASNALRIDDLFLIASQAAIGANKSEVIFDARFGFPTRITIDDLAGNRASVEEYRVRDFVDAKRRTLW